MKPDIDKLDRKMPFAEPSDEFFRTIQDNVIAKITNSLSSIEKQKAKIISLNLKWLSAAAIVFIAGISAFFGLQNNSDKTQIAKQSNVIGNVYSDEKSSKPILAENTKPEKPTEIVTSVKQNVNQHHKISKPKKIQNNENDELVSNIQDYPVENNAEQDAVDKILVAFTPEQIRDIDKNSEQDLYLDLYN